MGMSPILTGAIAGFGGGLSNIAGALAEQRKEALAREKIDQDLQYRDAVLTADRDRITQSDAHFKATQAAAERAAGLAREDKFIQPSDTARFLQYLGVKDPAVPTGPMPVTMIPEVAKAALAQQEREREQDQRTRTEAFLQSAQAQPGRPEVPLPDDGGMGGVASLATLGRPAMGVEELSGGLMARGNKMSDVAALMKLLRPESEGKPLLVNDATRGYLDKNGTYVPIPGQVDKPDTQTVAQATAQGVFAVTLDKRTGQEISRVKIGDNVPHPPREPREPAQPTQGAAFVDVVHRNMAMKYGGGWQQNPKALAEAQDALKTVILSPGATLTGTGTNPGGVTNPPQPSGGERSDMADLRATVGSLETLIKDVAANKGVLGNVASNTGGAVRRSLSEYIPSMTTPAEKKFLASLSNQVATIKREFIGAAQTDPELKGLLDLLPDKGQVDVSVLPRLEAIRDHVKRKLTERQAPFAATPSGGRRIKFDAQGNQIP